MTAAKKTSVNKSAQIGTADCTLDDLTAAATKVGAPSTARVTTGGSINGPDADGNYLPYSVTFSWTDEV